MIGELLERCQDIPGYELFQYVDKDGTHHSVDSADVNEYLRTISNQDFTAKDFRTWAGSLLTCITLRTFESFESEKEANKNVVEAIKTVAARLGNTPSVCRKCYVHPAVLEWYMSGAMFETKRQQTENHEQMIEELRREEAFLLKLLRK